MYFYVKKTKILEHKSTPLILPIHGCTTIKLTFAAKYTEAI